MSLLLFVKAATAGDALRVAREFGLDGITFRRKNINGDLILTARQSRANEIAATRWLDGDVAKASLIFFLREIPR